jgi:hypothetical protein
MPFSFCNASATFQEMINDVLKGITDKGVVAYLDDILIYAEAEDENDKLVD